LLRLLQVKKDELRSHYGIEWQLTGVATRRLGWLVQLSGLNPDVLLAAPEALSAHRLPEPTTLKDWLTAAQATALFETTALNAQSGQPAIEYLRTALEQGVHAITANKGPVVFAYAELAKLAQTQGRHFLFESTVMDGAPIFSLFRETLPGARLIRFRGILNSTTNFILGEIETGSTFEVAVQKAQAIGIAETDPRADVEGWDAAVKVAALRTVLMNTPLKPQDVARQGIQGLTPEAIRAARAAGQPYKLVCQADRQTASVCPTQVLLTDPLANVNGTSSIIHFETDTLSGLTLTEHNPGPETTAYGLLADFINAVKN